MPREAEDKHRHGERNTGGEDCNLLPPWPAEQLVCPLLAPPALPLRGAAPLGEPLRTQGEDEEDGTAGEAAGGAVPASSPDSDVADRDRQHGESDSEQPSAQAPGLRFPEALQQRPHRATLGGDRSDRVEVDRSGGTRSVSARCRSRLGSR